MNREDHFKRLNAYRRSREYLAYARAVGLDTTLNDMHERMGVLPNLLGVRWQITERIYTEFLEILPPMRWTGTSFLMSEFVFGTITTKYTKEGDRYFCEFVDTKVLP